MEIINKIKRNKFSLKLWIIRMIIIFIFLSFILSINKTEGNIKINISLNIPKVSIFLPIFNKEEFLIRSINSIQVQTLKDIEIVAINDGSTDNTLKILKKLSKKDFRIKIINNDRNHGLLYSRAKGILNSRGEYLMNLDPDDKLEGKDNLYTLYKKAKKSNLDYIKFLIKRIPINEGEIEMYKELNKVQLKIEDYLITNKFIKREIFLRAYNYFHKEIYSYKWNYHEDNIWNILIQKYSKNTEIFNKYIYIYKRNNDSLNMRKDNLFEIKNRIYRLKMLNKINENNNNDSYIYSYKYYQSHQIIVNSCNISILKDNEIKKKLIDISIDFLNIFNDNIEIKRNANNIINKINENKIILFFNSYNKTLIDYLTLSTIFNILKENNRRIIISIDVNNNNNFDNIINYIYSNDIILGIEEEIIFNENFQKILKNYCENKIIILDNDILINTLNNNKILYNSYNLMFYYYNQNFFNKSKKKHLIPDFVTHTANYFNYKKKNSKKINLTLIYYYFNNESIKIIKNICSKYLININNINLTEIFNNITNLSEIIKESEFILTDSIDVMELSILYFTSCILYNNFTQNYETEYKEYKLNYIKTIHNINDLEKNLIDLKDISNNYNIKKKYKNIYLDKEFKLIT